MNEEEILAPINIDKSAWCYPERDCLLVVQEARNAEGGYLLTTQTKVSWKIVERAMKRRDRAFPKEMSMTTRVKALGSGR